MYTIDDYICSHISPEPEALRRLYRHTHMHRLYPRMCTDHAEGRLLVMLTRMIRPHHILELGTFSGYSTLCFAEGSEPVATIDTVEKDTDYADDLRELFASEAPGRDITLHTADALDALPQLLARRSYDLVFIDADKRAYDRYYSLIADALPSGAYIIADNTLWDGKVTDPDATDPQTEGIRRFNDAVAADARMEKVILDVADGLTIIRKK